MAATIDIYYWPTPNGHKITICCEEMGLPYTIKPVNIGRGEQFTPEFLAMSPNNRMPAIVDPDGPGGAPIAIFESGAIMQYLGRKTGQFYPADERARVKVDEWVHWQMANLGPNAGQRNHFRNYSPSFLLDQRHSAYGANRYTNEVNRLYGVLDGQLAGREYITGDYSIADMISWPWIQGRSDAALQIEDFPHLKAWKDRVGARPAVKAALEAAKAVTGGAGLQNQGRDADQARSVLFGQRARR
jgi:GST-like protein